MSKFESIYLCLTAAGFLSILLNLRVLIQQTRFVQDSVGVSASSSVGERQVAIDHMFLEYPALRQYFLENVPIAPGELNYEATLAAAQLLANYFDTYFIQGQKYPQLYSKNTWLSYINDHLGRSSILRQVIIEFRGWYTDDLVNAAIRFEGSRADGVAHCASSPLTPPTRV